MAAVGYSGAPPPARFNAVRYCLQHAAAATPDKRALLVATDATDSSGDETWSFGEIERAVLALAAGFAEAGLQRGDRLVLRMRNSSQFALVFFAAMAAGLVPVPTSDQLSAEEIGFVLADSAAAALAVSPDMELPRLADDLRVFDEASLSDLRAAMPRGYADTAADDPAFLIYTSGTSGRPKGVLHAHRSVWGRRPMYRDWYGIGCDDVMVHAGAFNWTYTLGVGLSDPWANGATAVVFNGQRRATIWTPLIERAGGTIFAAVPTVYRQMLKYCDLTPASMPSLRHGLTAGEALPRTVADEWRARTGRPLYEALGMSEISTYISSSPHVPVRPGSPGRPQAGRVVAVLSPDDTAGADPLPPGESGLLAVHRSDPGLMLGYWNRPEEMREVMRGDWFCGGDLASIDTDGYVWFEGRSDDLMNAMGYRVAPQEVEQVLARHDAVAECAVTDIEVRPDVRIIAAFVVPTPDCVIDPQAVQRYAAARLAAYKCPREIFVVDALPRTANGKLRRRDLRPPDAGAEPS